MNLRKIIDIVSLNEKSAAENSNLFLQRDLSPDRDIKIEAGSRV